MIDVSSESINREAKVWIEALSASNFGQRVMKVKTRWLSTSSRSSITRRQRRTKALALRPARLRTTGSAWSRVRSATGDHPCRFMRSGKCDLHRKWKTVPHFQAPNPACVEGADVIKKFDYLTLEGKFIH